MGKEEKIALLIFAFLSIIGIYHHELWLDESQRWLLAKDSFSLEQLIYNKRYEGHPSLWYLILYAAKQISSHSITLQISHAIIALISVFLLLRYAPFSKWMRILFIFGYFPFYEYHIITGNYALVFLGMLLFCVFYNKAKTPYWSYGILLGAMANTHILGLIASFALFLFFLFDLPKKVTNKQKRQIGFSIGFYIALVLLMFLHSLPPEDHPLRINFGNQLMQSKNWLQAFMKIEKSFIPIPDFTQHQFWNNYLITYLPKPIRLFLLFALLASLIKILLPYKKALFLFGIAILGNFIFALVFPFIGIRYYGFFYLFFWISLWLVHKKNQTIYFKQHEKWILYSLLGLHCFAGLIGLGLDVQKSFSQAPNTTKYIQKHIQKDAIIAVDNYVVGPPISAYLYKEIYYLAEQRMGSFCNWTGEKNMQNEAIILQNISALQNRNKDKSIIFVSNKELDFSSQKLIFLKSFTGSLYPSHDYFLYEYKKFE